MAAPGLTLRRHPLALLREKLRQRGVLPTQDLWEQPNGKWVRTAGLVITRQRPGSAGGVTFVTMEDETGYVNLIVWNRVADEQRAALLESRLLEVQRQVAARRRCAARDRAAADESVGDAGGPRGRVAEFSLGAWSRVQTSSPIDRISARPLLLVTMPARSLKSNLRRPSTSSS